MKRSIQIFKTTRKQKLKPGTLHNLKT